MLVLFAFAFSSSNETAAENLTIFFTSYFVTFVNIWLLFTYDAEVFQCFECYGKKIECYFFFRSRGQILKTEYKYGQYCTPLSQSNCRYFSVLAIKYYIIILDS